MSDESPLTQRDVESLRVTLDKLDRTVDKFMEAVDDTYVRKDVLEPQLAALQRTQSEHADWLKWAQRLVLGAVILALVGLALTGH